MKHKYRKRNGEIIILTDEEFRNLPFNSRLTYMDEEVKEETKKIKVKNIIKENDLNG